MLLNEWRTLVRCHKLLKMHFSEASRLSSRTSGVRPRKMQTRMSQTQSFYRGAKSDPTTISLFWVISASNFGLILRGLQSTFLASSLTCFPKYRLESELVGGNTKVQPRIIGRMAKAPPTSGERPFGVRNH